MSADTLKEHLDALGAIVHEHTAALHALEGAKADPLIVEKMHKLEADWAISEEKIHRLQTALARPLASGGGTTLPTEERLQKEAFAGYVRKGGEPTWESKSLSASGGDPEGGYLIPHAVSHQIHGLLQEASFFRKLARVSAISTDSLDLLVDRGEAAAAWVQERSERPETETPELTALRIPVHEMYAKPRATQRLLDDAFINVESWLSEKIAQQMGHIESKAFVHGDGEGKPKGFLAYPRQVGDTPWGQLEEVTTGVAGSFAAEDPEAALLDVFHRLKPAYGEGASWVMSRTAHAAIRRLKDPVTGHYFWQPTLSADQKTTLMGYPVYVTDHMPALAPGQASASVAFGNFAQAYQIVDRQGIQILRDPYSAKPYVEFYATKRVGGEVINFEAIKILNFAASV